MPRPPRRRPGTISSPVLPHFTVTPKQLSDKIKNRLVDDYKKRLNVRRLPTDVMDGIISAAKEAAQRSTKRNLEVEATKIAKTFYQDVDITQLIGTKLKQASVGVSLVSQSADLDSILKENAQMIRKKWKALNDAGFSKDEAFQLIKAEVEGKAARSR